MTAPAASVARPRVLVGLPVAVGLALAIVLAGRVSGRGATAAAVGIVQALLVLGLAGAVHPPTARRTAAVAGVAGLAADVATATGHVGSLRRLTPLIGVVLVLCLAAEVTRRERPGTTPSLSASVALALLAVAPATAVVLRGLPAGGTAVTAVAVAALVGASVVLLTTASGPTLAAATVLGAVAGALTAGAGTDLEVADGAVFGLPAAAAAGVAAAVLVGVARGSATPPRFWAALGALPLAAGLTAGALAGRLVLG